MDIKNKVTMIDDTFSSYLMDNNKKYFCNTLQKILGAFSKNKSFAISIVDNSRMEKEPFFGMRIFPSDNFIDGICRQIVSEDIPVSLNDMCKRWNNIGDWVIEIDSRIFDRYSINLNPQELTAVLLHEIGHTVYSDQKIEMFYRVYKECRLRMTLSQRASAKILYRLYMIPLTLVCGFRNWQMSDADLKEEIFADHTVEELGYGEHLLSAMEKIVKSYGSSGTISIKTNQKLAEDALERSITWCNLNIADMEKRKERIKDDLYLTGAKTNSFFIQANIKKLMHFFGIQKKEKYTGNIATEAMIDFANESFIDDNKLIYDFKTFNKLANMVKSTQNTVEASIANEGFFKKNDPIPNQLDVDTIFVEVDRIENHADRRYVLDLIFNQEEKIENFKERFRYDKELKKKYEHKMNSMLKELASMRIAVLNKRSFDKEYKLFVKYPSGYEG